MADKDGKRPPAGGQTQECDWADPETGELCGAHGSWRFSQPGVHFPKPHEVKWSCVEHRPDMEAQWRKMWK